MSSPSRRRRGGTDTWRCELPSPGACARALGPSSPRVGVQGCHDGGTGGGRADECVSPSQGAGRPCFGESSRRLAGGHSLPVASHGGESLRSLAALPARTPPLDHSSDPWPPPRPIPTTLTASTEAPLQTQLYGFSALVLGGTAESVSLLFLPPQNLIAPVGGQHPRKVQEATQGCVLLITLLWRMRLLIQYHMFSESLLSARHCLVIATVMMNEPEIILAFKQLTIHVRKIAIINFK